MPRTGRPPLPLLLLLALVAGPAHGALPSWIGEPGYTVRAWTRKEGLPAVTANSVTRSGDGYLWVGTYDGVIRFDGVRLRVFDAGSDSGLTLNRLPNVQEDDDGRIVAWGEAPWIAVHEGGRFRTYGAEFGLPSVAVVGVLSDHEFLVGTLQGVYRFTGDAFVPLHPELAEVAVETLLRRRDGSVAIALRDGRLVAFQEGRVTPLTLLDSPARFLFEDRDGVLWLGTDTALLHLEDGRAVPEPLPPPLHIIEPGRSGILWVGTRSGLFRRLSSAGDWERLSPRACSILREGPGGAVWGVADSILFRDGREMLRAPSTVMDLLEDPAGNIWLATADHGLVRMSPARVVAVGPAEDVTAVISDDATGFWLAMGSSGVRHIGPSGDRFYPTAAAIRTLHRDGDGTLLAGAFNGFFALEGERFVPAAGPEKFGRVYGIGRSAAGELWLSGFSKLARRTAAGWETIDDLDGFAGGPIRFGAAARDGSVWFASPEGPMRYRDGRVRRYAEADGLPTKRMRAVHVDDRGVVWLGTEGRGLLRMELDDAGNVASIGTIDERRGLFENGVRWVGEDADGYLWMTSNRGLFGVSRQELDEAAAGRRARVHYRLFDESSGFLNSAGSQVGVPAAHIFDGGLAVPTDAGMALLSTRLEASVRGHAPLHVEEVVVDGQTYFAGGGALTLPPRQRSFEVRYTGIDLTNPEHVQFRYRLEGAEDAWTEAGTRRTAYFTHVPPGDHTFHVQMTGADGDWIEGGTSLHLRVPPLFWETPWFAGLVVLLVAGLAAAAFQVRLRLARRRELALEAMVRERTAELARQAERLAELDQAKSRFFANVSHEFRTPLTLTIGPIEDLLSGMHGDFGADARRELATALASSRSVLDLVNQILDLAKLESGQFRASLRRQDLVDSLRRLVAEFHPLSERRKIHLSLELPAAPILAVFDEFLFQRAVRNLLSNAFKFTSEGGRVSLHLAPSADGTAAEIAVRDTGAGIAREEIDQIFDRFHQAAGALRAEPGTGIGLSLAREIVDLHGGSIRVESRLGEGSTFTVRLPLDAAETPAAERPVRAATVPVVHAPLSADTPIAATNGAPDTPSPFGAEPAADDDRADRTTILIAEDHPQVRAFVRKHVDGRYRVLEAGDGRRALDLARKHLPDLIVSDVMMPHMDGMELTRAVKGDADIGFIPVLLLTARAEVEDRVTAYDFGADAYLAKPFEPRELVARIDGLIRERRRLKRHFAGAPADDALAGLASADEVYMKSVAAVIRKNLADEDFGVEELAKALGQTRTTLFRRLKDIGAATPSALIRQMRLEQARALLERGAGSVNEVAYGVGFRSVSHFCTAFRETYGKAPGQWKAGRDTPVD